MDHLRTLPDSNNFFSFTRRYVGNPERTLRAVQPAEAFKSFELWVGQALAALAKLHDAGFLHGSIDPSALIINEDGNLRLGGLQKVRELGSDVGNLEFNPTNLYQPPEYHLYAAFRGSVPFQRAYESLQQSNWVLDQLQTIYPSFQASRSHMWVLYEKVQSPVEWSKMQQESDVFMLGFALLTVYYEMLEKWPYASGEDFYENKHEAFHDLIEEMTRFQPNHRVTAQKALDIWDPSAFGSERTAIASEPQQPSDAPNGESVASLVSQASQPVVSLSSSEASHVSLPQKNRRVLALQSHPEGRNKTRRSPRNSSLNSATGNP